VLTSSYVHLCTVVPHLMAHTLTVTARLMVFVGDENAGCAPASREHGAAPC